MQKQALRWSKPSVIIFSNANVLSLHLVENLLSKSCEVSVYSQKPGQWTESTQHIRDNENFKIFNIESKLPDRSDYLFIAKGFDNSEFLENKNENNALDKIFRFIEAVDVKAMVVTPFVVVDPLLKQWQGEVEDRILKTPKEVEFVFVGELFGPRMSFTNSTVQLAIKSVFSKTAVAVSDKNIIVYPVFVGDVVEELVTAIFSYGFGNKKTVLANKLPFIVFFHRLRELAPSAQYVENLSTQITQVGQSDEFYEPRLQASDSLEKTIEWLSTQNLVFEEEKVTVPEVVTVKNTIKRPKMKLRAPRIQIPKAPPIKVNLVKWAGPIALLLLMVFLIIPFGSIFTSGVTLNFAYKSALKGNFERTAKLLDLSQKSANLAKRSTAVAGSTPLIGRAFRQAENIAEILFSLTITGKRGLVISDLGEELVSGVLGDESYNVEALASSINVELDALYRETSFLQGSINEFGFFDKKILGQIEKFQLARQYALTLRDVSQHLPSILGAVEPKTYLVLFQNNMELRPTGGFIGSFAMVTFDNGKLLDVNVFDVYSADGQLKGHIEPPTPIKYYLGEANWFLRDSNWDPDFPTSAARAEWFLEKEIDRSVDGVVSIDLNAINSIVEILEPLELVDFQTTIDHKNLYERVQYEVEANFFPGSRKKANFLTALYTTLTDRIVDATKEQYPLLGLSIINSLSQKSIQLFMHDKSLSSTIDSLGWGGEVEVPRCAGNCAVNYLGIVEANVGVNKANYFVSRTASLVSQVDSDFISNRLTINLENEAPTALGVSGKYKTYLRVLSPLGSSFGQVNIGDAGKVENLDAIIEQVSGRTEAGVLVEVGPNSQKSITFSWKIPVELNFARPGEIKLVWRKQAGTLADPISLQTLLPQGVFLTENVLSSYNTILSEDFATTLSW